MLDQIDMEHKLDSILLRMQDHVVFHTVMPLQTTVEKVDDVINNDDSSFLPVVVKVYFGMQSVFQQRRCYDHTFPKVVFRSFWNQSYVCILYEVQCLNINKNNQIIQQLDFAFETHVLYKNQPQERSLCLVYLNHHCILI